VTLLEYRNKTGAETELLADAEILRRAMPTGQVKLILDDRADLIEKIGFDGVHVDAGDLTAAEARKLLGPSRIIGTFGGSTALLPGILAEPVDYLSHRPGFSHKDKADLDSAIGMEEYAGCAQRPALVLSGRYRRHNAGHGSRGVLCWSHGGCYRRSTLSPDGPGGGVSENGWRNWVSETSFVLRFPTFRKERERMGHGIDWARH